MSTSNVVIPRLSVVAELASSTNLKFPLKVASIIVHEFKVTAVDVPFREKTFPAPLNCVEVPAKDTV